MTGIPDSDEFYHAIIGRMKAVNKEMSKKVALMKNVSRVHPLLNYQLGRVRLLRH